MIVLETERLLFRDHEPQDLEAFCGMEMDPDVRRFVGGRPRTREDAEQKFRAMLSREDRLPFCAMVLKANKTYVGRCGLHPMSGGAVGLGFYVAKPFWSGA